MPRDETGESVRQRSGRCIRLLRTPWPGPCSARCGRGRGSGRWTCTAAPARRGDAGAVLRRDGLSGASVAVLDPPRTGAARSVIDLLCDPSGAGADDPAPAAGLRRIAYVSCDPATLARDIAVFRECGWQLETLRAFDAFPMTHHVECLAALVPGAGAAITVS